MYFQILPVWFVSELISTLFYKSFISKSDFVCYKHVNCMIDRETQSSAAACNIKLSVSSNRVLLAINRTCSEENLILFECIPRSGNKISKAHYKITSYSCPNSVKSFPSRPPRILQPTSEPFPVLSNLNL